MSSLLNSSTWNQDSQGYIMKPCLESMGGGSVWSGGLRLSGNVGFSKPAAWAYPQMCVGEKGNVAAVFLPQDRGSSLPSDPEAHCEHFLSPGSLV